MTDLSGKVALVTGASGGLGEHFARVLAGAEPFDGMVLTDTEAPQQRFDELVGAEVFPPGHVLAPTLLGVSRFAGAVPAEAAQ